MTTPPNPPPPPTPPGSPPPPPPPPGPPGPPPGPPQPPYGGYDGQPPVPPEVNSKKILVGIMGILFGGLGVHRFLLNDVTGGLLRILITVITCGLGSIIGLVEGIIYLTKSDAEFYQIYMVERRAWF